MKQLTHTELLELDAQYCWHPFTQMQTAAPPLAVVRGESEFLFDAQGHKYFDAVSSWWVNIHGHSNPAIAKAIARQALELEHVMFAGVTHPPAVQLAERLVHSAPAPMAKVFYSDNGSTAIEVALKMAFQYWQNKGVTTKKRIIALEGGYHGDTFAAMSVCDPVTGMHHLFNAALRQQLFVAAPRALMGRLAPHRAGEPAGVKAALGRWHTIVHLPDGARLEGGDVLHVEDTTYVGLTARTDEAGVQALRDFLAPAGRRVVAVPVPRYLHLKTAATYLGNGVLIAVPDFDVSAFEVDDVLRVDEGEPVAANTLRVRDHLLTVAGNPRTEARLRAFAESHGVHVVPLEISEFEKGDGSLTCLSLIW